MVLTSSLPLPPSTAFSSKAPGLQGLPPPRYANGDVTADEDPNQDRTLHGMPCRDFTYTALARWQAVEPDVVQPTRVATGPSRTVLVGDRDLS